MRAGAGVAPDRAHELVLGEDLGGVAGELPQQLELLAAELDAASVDVDGPGGGVDVQLADVQVAAGDAAQRALGDRADDGTDDEVGAVVGEVVVAAGFVGAHGRHLAGVADRHDGLGAVYAGVQFAGAQRAQQRGGLGRCLEVAE